MGANLDAASSQGHPKAPRLFHDSKERRIKRIRKLFDRLDTDKSGYVEFKELEYNILGLRGNAASEDTSRRLSRDFMSHADRDDDRRLSFEEFYEFVEGKEKELWKLFREMDQDSDGFVKRVDLMRAFSDAGVCIDEKGLDAFIGRADKDGNGLLDFPELRDFLIPLWKTSLPDIVQYYRDVYDPSLVIEFNPVVQPDPNKRLKSFLAGAVSGAVSRTSAAPLERIRVLMNTLTTKNQTFWRDFVNSAKAIYHADGVLGFWRGNLINVIRIAPSSAITFGVFEESKKTLARLEGVSGRDLSPLGRFLAGGSAGMVAMTTTYPFEVVQVRMMATVHVPSGTAADGRSPLLLRIVNGMYRDGGLRVFYNGLLPSMIGIVPYAGFNFMTYESLKQSYFRHLKRHAPPHTQVEPQSIVLLAFGIIATSSAATATYPLATVRTRLQAQGTPAHPFRYDGMVDVFRRTWQLEGWWGFYRGLPASLTKAVPSASLSYVVYEWAKTTLGIASKND
ncbi:mitochondrial carrier [Gonapodya prolifera JEL478]|uniref:Mitochondrial carrier n=1 Tax=Gonapodya prolifera (strain JEL478) TaxID=1344416 RepID=A0A139AWG0_GONPJ|nr:mitochondrial carrier [Gonapodya prolifera JEL478]|eukprot:KXS21060.1 mitochondrial carrier [Gonapodya prolifera JEL478]